MTENTTVRAELIGSVISWAVGPGDEVSVGAVLGLIESMKLHHEIVAPVAGTISSLRCAVGESVEIGDALIEIDAGDESRVGSETDQGEGRTGSSPLVGEAAERPEPVPSATPGSMAHPSSSDDRHPHAGTFVAGASLAGVADAHGDVARREAGRGSEVRADLAEVLERRSGGADAGRPQAVERRREQGRYTARENIDRLVDPGSFVEYGGLAVASQRSRRSHRELVEKTPADGMIAGIGSVSGPGFVAARRVAIVAYDYTVLAGTQGHRNHLKKDRLFEVARSLGLPVVLLTEGGGGRPGDTDTGGASGLDSRAFGLLAELSGTVPLIAINAGYCFAGNAALLGVCDVVISTTDSNIGMAGPAMIAGGGLGDVAPTDIGPTVVQSANGVVDVVVPDEPEGIEVARRYLSYFQADWPRPSFSHPERLVGDTEPDVMKLRSVVPEDRMRAYEMREVIRHLFDLESVLELRAGFGRGMITALARVNGRPVGVIANDPRHLSGAIDSDGADKAARFMQLCDTHGLPIITLVDTPGMMVGPDVEATGLVRHCSRLFVHGANLTVPMISVVTRKAYGLGAQAMMGGSTKAPIATFAWPTGEFGPMGLEGAVELGYRNELAACASSDERAALFEQLVNKLYERGKALSIAEYYEIDDVIDPADTRQILAQLLEALPPRRASRPHLDTW